MCHQCWSFETLFCLSFVCLFSVYLCIPLCARAFSISKSCQFCQIFIRIFFLFPTPFCCSCFFSFFFPWKRAYILWNFIFISHNCLECMHNIHMPLVFFIRHTKRSNSLNAGHPFLYLRIYIFVGFFVLDICLVIAAFLMLLLLICFLSTHTRNKKILMCVCVCAWSKFSNLWLLLY